MSLLSPMVCLIGGNMASYHYLTIPLVNPRGRPDPDPDEAI